MKNLDGCHDRNGNPAICYQLVILKELFNLSLLLLIVESMASKITIIVFSLIVLQVKIKKKTFS